VLGEDARVRSIYDRVMTTMGTAQIPESSRCFLPLLLGAWLVLDRG
jgi:hypothetical protein